MNYDVIIIGAGPGGSTAAYYLAHAGLKVLLLDKADFPRDKTCGDGLTPHALPTLAAVYHQNSKSRHHLAALCLSTFLICLVRQLMLLLFPV